MAVLQPNQSGGSGLNIEDNAPAGQYVAVCVEIVDQFGVERQKFQSTEMVKRDVTRFVFGVYDAAQKLYLVQTYEFTISTAPASNLMAFLKSWLGQEPQMGWDYMSLKGQPAAISVQHKQSTRNPGVTYANIIGIAPIFPQMVAMVPPVHIFAPLMLEAAKPRDNAPKGGMPARPAGTGPAPTTPWPSAPALQTPPAQQTPPPAQTPPGAAAPVWTPPAAPAGGFPPTNPVPQPTGALPF